MNLVLSLAGTVSQLREQQAETPWGRNAINMSTQLQKDADWRKDGRLEEDEIGEKAETT